MRQFLLSIYHPDGGAPPPQVLAKVLRDVDALIQKPKPLASESSMAAFCPRDINTPLLDKRPEPPAPEVRARMLQPEDLAACVWLVATLPARVVLDEISLSTR